MNILSLEFITGLVVGFMIGRSPQFHLEGTFSPTSKKPIGLETFSEVPSSQTFYKARVTELRSLLSKLPPEFKPRVEYLISKYEGMIND